MTYVIYDNPIKADSNRLINNVFSRAMLEPHIDLILNSILDDKNCNDTQSKNNIAFLEDEETTVSNYVFEYDFDLDFNIEPEYKCGCIGDCERQCYENAVVMYSFRGAIKEFEIILAKDDSIFNDVFIGDTIEECDRIGESSWAIARILLYRELGRWAFHHGFYDTASLFHGIAILMYGAETARSGTASTDFINDEISIRNQRAANKRWELHREDREKRKKEYIQIMIDKGFSTYTDAATYIKLHVDTGKSPSFNTVCRLLSEADKGNFS